MSNLALKLLRERGIITGDVLPFARAAAAQSLVERLDDRRVVIEVMDSVNTGCYWVMSGEDGRRMEAAGYKVNHDPSAPAPPPAL